MSAKLIDAYTFVVRLWRERDDSGASVEWRGEVTDVTSGRSRPFRLFSGLMEAVHRLMNGGHGRIP